MAGILRIMKPEEEKVINRLLADEGVVLVTEAAATQIAAKLGIVQEELDELYLDTYDYGGEADKWVDIVRSEDHICTDYIENQFSKK